MSKLAKKRNSDRRRDEKRKRKAANTARFASFIGTAANKKSKGITRPGSRVPGHPHTSGHCGNIGCPKCYPELNL